MDLEDFDNGTAYAHYGSFGVGLFSVDPEEDGFPLTVADYSGTAGREGSRLQRAEAGGNPPISPHRRSCQGKCFCLWSQGFSPSPPRPTWFSSPQTKPAGPAVFAHLADEQSEPGKGSPEVWLRWVSEGGWVSLRQSQTSKEREGVCEKAGGRKRNCLDPGTATHP